MWKKTIYTVEKNGIILNWLQNYYAKSPERIAYMVRGASDFQGSKIINITLTPSQAAIDNSITHDIVAQNLIPFCFFLTIRHSVAPTWLNDRDQFLYPRDGWQTDTEFQNNCLTFTLFSNTIQSAYGTNHWIPFTEEEVNAQSRFTSHFMTDFISGKLAKHQLPDQSTTSLRELGAEKSFVPTEPLVFHQKLLQCLMQDASCGGTTMRSRMPTRMRRTTILESTFRGGPCPDGAIVRQAIKICVKGE